MEKELSIKSVFYKLLKIHKKNFYKSTYCILVLIVNNIINY